MPEPRCYICAKPGEFDKLLRKCRHESACYDCLRNRYVIKAQQGDSFYPLQCFHPECNLLVRNTQMKRFVRSEQELQNYYRKAIRAKKDADMERTRLFWLGPYWGDVAEALGEHEVCRCPRCKAFIMKDGGCDDMTCLCGAEFNWKEYHKEVEKSYQNVKEKYDRLLEFYNSRSSKIMASQSEKKKKEKRAAFIQIDDDDAEDYGCEDASTPTEEDFSAPEEELAHVFCEVETATQACTTSLDPTDLDSVPSDFDSNFPPISEMGVSAAELHTEYEQDDFHVLEVASDASDDSWTQFDDSKIESCDDFTLSSSYTAAWEQVPEVSSVVSFNSKTGMSFLEAARAKVSSTKSSRGSSWKEVIRVPRPMSQLLCTIAEDRKPVLLHDEEDHEFVGEMFDAEFMFDGAKGSRGGKQKFKTKVE